MNPAGGNEESRAGSGLRLAPIGALVLAPLSLLTLTGILATMDQFGDVNAGEWATYVLLLLAFGAIGYGAGVIFRNKLRAG